MNVISFLSHVVDAYSKYNDQCEDRDVEQAKSCDLPARSGDHCRLEDASQSLERQGNQKISSDSFSLLTSDVSGIQKIIPLYNDVSMFRGFFFFSPESFKVDLGVCPIFLWIMLKED
jgi:hypothetical protein